MMSMKNRDFGIVLMAVMAFTHGLSARGQDKVVGAIWEIKYEAENHQTDWLVGLNHGLVGAALGKPTHEDDQQR